jgi:hypothetical protein
LVQLLTEPQGMFSALLLHVQQCRTHNQMMQWKVTFSAYASSASSAAGAVTSDNIFSSGHGSVFRGEVGNGEGRIKVFAPSGSDISLQLT